MSQIGQFQFDEILNTLTGNTGDIVHPQVGNINILATDHFSFAGNNTTATLTLSMDGEIADTYTTDSGNAVPALNIIRILGGVNINTAGATNAVTINLDDSIILPITSSDGLAGLYSLGATRFMHGRGTLNTFLGEAAGTLSLTVGSATNNVGLGANCLTSVATSSYSTAAGSSSLTSLTGGVGNTTYGALSGGYLLTGSGNLLLGRLSGTAYVGSESDNICLANIGVVGTSNKAYYGTYGTGSGQVDTSTIAGHVHATNALTVDVGNLVITSGNEYINSISADTIGSELFLKKSRAVGTPAILSGDAIGTISFQAHDGTTYHEAAVINSVSSGTIGTDRTAANLAFWTAPDTVGGATKRLEIKSTGEVVIETPDSGIALTVGGIIAATTFDTNVAAAAVTLTGTTLSADGTDANININITAKGTGQVIIDDLQLGTPLTVQYGGTGASTLTDHGVLLGNGTSAVTATAEGTTGVILTGVTGAVPTWTTATYPATVAIGDVLVASATNVIGIVTGAATATYVLTANGAGTAPTFQAPAATGIVTLAGDSGTATGSTVTIAGGSNITTSATSATVTVDLDNSITLSGDVTALNLKTSTAATNITINGNSITAGGSDTNVDLNFVTKGSGGWTYDGIAAGWASSQWNMRQSSVQTTDATVTTLVSIALAEGEMVIINDTINGFQSDFTDAVGATVSITAYRPTGGNVTQIGEEIINLNSTSTSSVTAGVNVGTQSVIIQINGVLAETWNWVSTHQYMFTKTNA
jgi:hypothetical protein